METNSQRAERFRVTLNVFIGALVAATLTMKWWRSRLRVKDLEPVPYYALQMCYGHIALNLRKFEDLWTHHLGEMLPPRSESHLHAQWILEGCAQRKLRKTANIFYLHYARRRIEWPISLEAKDEFHWTRHYGSLNETLEWVDQVDLRLMSIRDDIKENTCRAAYPSGDQAALFQRLPSDGTEWGLRRGDPVTYS